MLIGAQTHFGQGWGHSLFKAIQALGVDAIRDGIPWAQIERGRGVYDFEIPRASWVDEAVARGVAVTLTFAHSNPLYDGGHTVYSDAGRKAFADFVVATLQRFPGVAAIEIGNEFNTNYFVDGPIRGAALSQRDDYYAKLLEAVDAALDAAGIDVAVVGGATHSIPVDYFADLKALGALDHLDAISIHPYTTPPEQFEAQIAILRQTVGPDIAIRVTEFGAEFASLAEAPAYLAKMVAVMGAAGIDSASWYALAKQSAFPNMELWDQSAAADTPAGAAFAFLDGLLASGGAIERREAGDFVHLYALGDRAAILWGTAAKVALERGVTAYDLSGRPLAAFDGRISADVPVVLVSDHVLTSRSVAVTPAALVADSFEQFDGTNAEGGTAGFEGPWSYFALSGDGMLTPLGTMGGGLRGGEGWTPYIGSQWLRPLQVSATSVTPADFANGTRPGASYSIVERYTVHDSGTFTLTGSYDVADHSKDGVRLEIRVNGVVVLDHVIFDKAGGHTYSFTLEHQRLMAGDAVEFRVDPRGNSKGDVTQRQIRIFDEGGHAPDGGPAEMAFLDYSAMTRAVQVDLLAGRATVNGRAVDITGSNVIGTRHDDRLTGDAAANVLIGGDGSDRIDGGRGADRMDGGNGDDLYYVDNAGDLVVERDVSGGQDTVWTSVSYGLGDNVERLYLSGNAGIDATGNDLRNILKGNAGDNILSGKGGADKMTGGGGADTFVFDTLDAANGLDVITDFEVGVDSLLLDHAIFAALADGGGRHPVELGQGRAASGAGDFLFYDRRAGILYYDEDGAGPCAALAIVKLNGAPELGVGDILVV